MVLSARLAPLYLSAGQADRFDLFNCSMQLSIIRIASGLSIPYGAIKNSPLPMGLFELLHRRRKRDIVLRKSILPAGEASWTRKNDHVISRPAIAAISFVILRSKMARLVEIEARFFRGTFRLVEIRHPVRSREHSVIRDGIDRGVRLFVIVHARAHIPGLIEMNRKRESPARKI